MKNIKPSIFQLRQELSGLNFFGDDAISQIQTALQLIRSTTSAIEAEIDGTDFASQEDEIYYFRHVKPPLYSLQIAYRKILKLELLRPSFSKKEFKSILKQKLDFIQGHYIDYPEFTRYYNSTLTEYDQRYFLKANCIDLDYFPLYYDYTNSTGYDLVAAYLLAYKFLIDHYDQSEKKSQIEMNQLNTSWSSDKLDYVELVSGIHIMASLNMGKDDLKTVNSQLCHMFNIEIKDFYGKRNEIKSRKGIKFRYIKEMFDRLEEHFDENLE
jgi:hypothetical protein